jgi:hypothetical protein
LIIHQVQIGFSKWNKAQEQEASAILKLTNLVRDSEQAWLE